MQHVLKDWIILCFLTFFTNKAIIINISDNNQKTTQFTSQGRRDLTTTWP